MLAVAACGGDDSTPSSEPAPASVEPGADAGTSPTTTRLWIGPELVDCEGVAPQKCMQVAESEHGPFEFFYDGIEGFEFVEMVESSER